MRGHDRAKPRETRLIEPQAHGVGNVNDRLCRIERRGKLRIEKSLIFRIAAARKKDAAL
jgi:hypothetical protein